MTEVNLVDMNLGVIGGFSAGDVKYGVNGEISALVGDFKRSANIVILNKGGSLKDRVDGIKLGEGFDDNHLTGKESLVYLHLLFGMPLGKIASSMHITQRTVSFHIEKIKAKIGVDTLVGLISVAFRTGLAYTIFDYGERVQCFPSYKNKRAC